MWASGWRRRTATGRTLLRGSPPRPRWHTGKPLATLEAADINGDGVPDLWTVTPAGAAQAYLISHLSASGTARMTAGKRQQLP